MPRATAAPNLRHEPTNLLRTSALNFFPPSRLLVIQSSASGSRVSAQFSRRILPFTILLLTLTFTKSNIPLVAMDWGAVATQSQFRRAVAWNRSSASRRISESSKSSSPSGWSPSPPPWDASRTSPCCATFIPAVIITPFSRTLTPSPPFINPCSTATKNFSKKSSRIISSSRSGICACASRTWKLPPAEIARRWLEVELFRLFVPFGTPPYLRDLFCSNLRAILGPDRFGASGPYRGVTT